MKQQMRIKAFSIKLINILCMCAILFVYQECATTRQKKIHAMEEKVLEQERSILAEMDSPYKDGAYTGSGQGFNGKITVELVIKEGIIDVARALDAKEEDPEYFEQAAKIFEKVVKRQSLNVDVVTGATYSSYGIIDGLDEALQKAKK